ncbi:MAG: FecR domain-containing protein [Gammaproteobacteria bacterium]|nr:FecR domain-containing protein [Gammaproteobacteria bacterium]
MNRLLTKFWRYPVACLLVALPLGLAHADAGQVLFVYGKAYVVSPDGSRAALTKGSTVDSGDRIVTSANGRVQMRMEDGGLLALRPQTEFLIEQFNFPAASGGMTASAGEPRSFFALVKGGFRSITGAIGKADKSDYRVRTPVATIGIRGTDYTAVYCETGCAGMQQGLYVGVTDGGVTLRNDTGALDLDPGQFGFVRDAASSPEKSAAAARLLAAEVAPEAAESDDAEADVEVASVTDSDVNLTSGGEALNGNSGAVAYAAGPLGDDEAFTAAAAQGMSGKVVNEDGSPIAFTADSPVGTALIEQNGSQAVNMGRDTDRQGATGLHWGRWTTGAVHVTSENGEIVQDVDNSSVHWVTGPDGNARVELPTEGTANFALIGNTNPTDNNGNVGTLGSANLSADFTSQTADADVSLSFDETGQVWDASARDVDINSDATFGGEFDDVTVTDSMSGESDDGDGSLSGFFSGDADGNLSGAGMSYTLEEDDTVVSGAAAFQVEGGGN